MSIDITCARIYYKNLEMNKRKESNTYAPISQIEEIVVGESQESFDAGLLDLNKDVSDLGVTGPKYRKNDKDRSDSSILF